MYSVLVFLLLLASRIEKAGLGRKRLRNSGEIGLEGRAGVAAAVALSRYISFENGTDRCCCQQPIIWHSLSWEKKGEIRVTQFEFREENKNFFLKKKSVKRASLLVIKYGKNKLNFQKGTIKIQKLKFYTTRRRTKRTRSIHSKTSVPSPPNPKSNLSLSPKLPATSSSKDPKPPPLASKGGEGVKLLIRLPLLRGGPGVLEKLLLLLIVLRPTQSVFFFCSCEIPVELCPKKVCSKHFV